MSIPIVNYRFGDRYLVTDFITPQNPGIKDIIDSLGGVSSDEFVEKVATHIRDNYEYPLDDKGNPATDGQIVRYRKGFWPANYQFRSCKFYVWAFPAEVIQSGLGYCAETANLAESLLFHKVDAWATLGDVMSLDGQLLGRHEWVEVRYRGEKYIMETTIHTEGMRTLIKASAIYDKNSDWAKKAKLYYVAKGWFNASRYEGDDFLAVTMDLPTQKLLHLGVVRTRELKAIKLYKERRRETGILKKYLMRAWRETASWEA